MDQNERPLTDEEWRLDELVREIFREVGGDPDAPFRPFAVFDEQLDRIWVSVRDCSYVEVRVNGGLSLLEDNYPEDDENKYVGFEIYATRGFYEHEGLLSGDSVELNQVLDILARRFPANSWQIKICRSLLGKLETTTVNLA